MKQKYSFGDCYKILLIKPDCSWEELRKSYKLLMKKWHPDRFDVNSPEKLIAEDKVKYITAAYKQLSEYHRTHGFLPNPINIEKSFTLPPYNSDPITQYSDNELDTSQNNNLNISDSPYNNFRFLIILIVLCFFIYATFIRDTGHYKKELPIQPSLINPKATNNSTSQIANTNEFQHDRRKNTPNEFLDKSNKTLETSEFNPLVEQNNGAEKFFSYGSTIGEVISIQGTPSKVEGDTWFYGESEVYFSDGAVLSWKRMSGSPLKAKIKMGNTNIETQDIDSNKKQP